MLIPKTIAERSWESERTTARCIKDMENDRSPKYRAAKDRYTYILDSYIDLLDMEKARVKHYIRGM